MQADHAPGKGFFVGAHVGYNYLKTKMDTTVNIPTGAITSGRQNLKKNERAHSFIGGFSVGYLWGVLGQYFAGIELEGNLDSIKLNNKNSVTILGDVNDFKNEISRNVSLVPAFIFGGTLTKSVRIFAKLGVAVSDIKYSVYNITDGLKRKENRLIVGLAPSLGVESMVTDCIALNLTTTYEFYKKDKVVFQRTVEGSIDTTNNVIQASFNNFSAKIGLTYYF